MAMGQLITRINELSRKHKTVGLTEEELAERDELRKKYLENFRNNFRQQLDNIEWVEDQEDKKQ
ncbi:DUF896 domain-containing protein [Paenibacillus sp. NEAU-GSW1]|uniref:DUF896 domain-containing protein n=1 Tax=Paenibacillus sp. NEAU-GSW1 TaxID=2682486 RepID=UPI0012E2E123|nr:DUF896 domain-containing protein [Paenibacillus sp. NEAU-GSW1]MUT67322.1 DUF896 domain-containing protein [Paenibacillus sp. NEAU-GSW1]